MGRHHETLRGALADHTPVGAPDECWEWDGPRDSQGYGQLTWHRVHFKAHRVAFESNIGPTLDGLVVRHSCDNPPCVNPAHLLIGTTADNNRDTRERRRHHYLNRTTCKNGHDLADASVYADRRRCLHCQRAGQRRKAEEKLNGFKDGVDRASYAATESTGRWDY